MKEMRKPGQDTLAFLFVAAVPHALMHKTTLKEKKDA